MEVGEAESETSGWGHDLPSGQLRMYRIAVIKVFRFEEILSMVIECLDFRT